MLYVILQGLIIGLFIGLIAAITAIVKRRKILKSSLVSDGTSPENTFEAEGKSNEGKSFDKQKYLEQYIEIYSGYSVKELNNIHFDLLKQQKKKPSEELSIQIKAMEMVFEKINREGRRTWP
jgi:hypothetical protein